MFVIFSRSQYFFFGNNMHRAASCNDAALASGNVP